jgi:hypothetical protein
MKLDRTEGFNLSSVVRERFQKLDGKQKYKVLAASREQSPPPRRPTRHFQSGFHMVPDRYPMGVVRRGYSTPPDGNQQQGQGERGTLRAPNCHAGRGIRRTSALDDICGRTNALAQLVGVGFIT